MTEFPVMILIDGYNAFDAVGKNDSRLFFYHE